ncbi:hypothetical protein RHO14_03240 [Orbus wheelerorum]|uniref:hypothetical protein n=1 Tax=Orbus wheelerorum TaxID=3074111 RepID=UPI00370D7300
MTNTIKKMTEVWGVTRSTILDFAFSDIKKIMGFAGIDMSIIAHLELKNGSTKSQLLSEIDLITGTMDTSTFNRFVLICCEKIIEIMPSKIDSLNSNLKKLGWSYIDNSITPIDILNIEELSYLPQDALTDINKAMTRFRENDLSGVVTSVCGALDSVTSNIYREYDLGDPTQDSFQQRIVNSIKALQVIEKLRNELYSQDGWDESDIKPFTKNLEGSFNQAAYVMQTLRSKIGDVHGTKSVIESLVYDSIKWSTLLLRMLS